MASAQQLDHLVLFVPADPETQLPKLPSFFASNFTLTPGGFHADGATSNTLILLADGCYLELISFIDASKAPSHWWGPDAKFQGWKDWCLTNSAASEENWVALGGKEGTHAEPIKGGRKRADGVEVKWAVTFPKGDKGGQDARGRIPFFCHDITARNVRVPLSEEKTAHPCGALGVGEITVIFKNEALLEESRQAYSGLLGSDGTKEDDTVTFQLGRVYSAEGLDSGAKVVLRLAKSQDEIQKTERTGFCYGNVVLVTKGDGKDGSQPRRRLDGGLHDVGGIWIEHN